MISIEYGKLAIPSLIFSNTNEILLNTLYIFPGGKAGIKMADHIIENIVVVSDIQQQLPLQTLAIAISEADYNEEDPLLIFRFEQPKRAVLVSAQGSIYCTGVKTIEEGTEYITKIINRLKTHGVHVEAIPEIRLQSYVVSTQIAPSFDLNVLAKQLQSKPIVYNPEQKPWIEYVHDDQNTIMIYASGKLVCTGTATLDQASEALENLSNTLLSIGVI